MFTGLIEATGELLLREPRGPGGARLTLRAPKIAAEATLGESVAVNGCCLTVTAFDAAAGTLSFDLLQQTLDVTNLGALLPGARVNLERSLRADARLGGHFVSGHIDCAAPVLGWEPSGGDWRLLVHVPAQYERYIIERGSAAVDGISLTIAAVEPGQMRFHIIPHTLQETNLGSLKPVREGEQTNQRVNLEFDLLAKYVERAALYAAKVAQSTS